MVEFTEMAKRPLPQDTRNRRCIAYLYEGGKRNIIGRENMLKSVFLSPRYKTFRFTSQQLILFQRIQSASA